MSPEILLLTLIYRSFCSCLPNMGVMEKKGCKNYFLDQAGKTAGENSCMNYRST